MKMDVLFVAEDYRPGWLGYGVGWLCGGWTAAWWLVWLWKSLGWWSVLIWPISWAFGFVLVVQLVLGISGGFNRLLGLNKRVDRPVGELLLILAWSTLAWHLMDSDSKVEAALGWIWWVALILVFFVEIGVKWRRRYMESADLRRMAQKAGGADCEPGQQ